MMETGVSESVKEEPAASNAQESDTDSDDDGEHKAAGFMDEDIPATGGLAAFIQLAKSKGILQPTKDKKNFVNPE